MGSLLAGRVAIVNFCTSNLHKAVVTAVRYSAVRKQFGPTAGAELPVIEYQLQVCYFSSPCSTRAEVFFPWCCLAMEAVPLFVFCFRFYCLWRPGDEGVHGFHHSAISGRR